MVTERFQGDNDAVTDKFKDADSLRIHPIDFGELVRDGVGRLLECSGVPGPAQAVELRLPGARQHRRFAATTCDGELPTHGDAAQRAQPVGSLRG
jgi:hypothetical protein